VGLAEGHRVQLARPFGARPVDIEDNVPILLSSIKREIAMAIETIGEAYSSGWRVTARCKYGRPDGAGPKPSRECGHRYELDMQTLVWT
jgi:hypothetical protein